jgi:hypothetical protein
MELHIASLKLEIEELNHAIEDSKAMIRIREQQRVISANRINQAAHTLEEYLKECENGSR